ncbi:MAG TPA: hypothetical protein VE934_02610 [Polaromonas sp.]|uniref:hypothetical protein n=1 Tax=Polaromonas sp. TaxID=1869339 RepID=UPI002D6190EA|nr:hypothetical protein [Polaromonas sp.]HYW55824.1 hypothetical protein [Polaromonas sp.]
MRFRPALRIATLLIAASAHPSWAQAQNDSTKRAAGTAAPAVAPCPPAKQIKPEQMYGLWRVQFTKPPAGLPDKATMLLERHAEFSESVAGFVNRDLGAAAGSPAVAGHRAKAQLAGDIEEGLVTLDESSNGISITGTWTGELVANSCGRKVTGVWKDTSDSAPPDAPDIPFTLEKVPGW